MASESASLHSLARSKLHLSFGSKDGCSLHRWVLLKNSITRTPASTYSPAATGPSVDVKSVYPLDDGEEDDDADEEIGSEEVDSFMFPDAGKFVEGHTTNDNNSEAQWLDSLLETLGDDDEDDFGVESDANVSVVPADDDELLSPIGSPMSSSDDLPSQPSYYPLPITVAYPVPYPPFHPPLIRSYEFDPTFDSPLVSLPAPYDDPLPYHDLDDAEESSVPDAIEDTSDDESDAPTTPSLGRSGSSLSLAEAASIPLPTQRSRLRHPPHVYVDSDDSYFYPFEFDPLPFPVDYHHRNNSYNSYQEC